MNRRMILAGGMILPGAALAAVPSPAPTPAPIPTPTLLIEQTYLKSMPGERESLRRFIIANWFAMDQRGVEQGIFTFYQLLETVDTNPDWDFVVAVGYPQGEGYEDPATQAAFKAIRAAHRETAIDGKTLKALGTIVQHHRLRLAMAG